MSVKWSLKVAGDLFYLYMNLNFKAVNTFYLQNFLRLGHACNFRSRNFHLIRDSKQY